MCVRTRLVLLQLQGDAMRCDGFERIAKLRKVSAEKGRKLSQADRLLDLERFKSQERG
jgi:hypothetical protein